MTAKVQTHLAPGSYRKLAKPIVVDFYFGETNLLV